MPWKDIGDLCKSNWRPLEPFQKPLKGFWARWKLSRSLRNPHAAPLRAFGHLWKPQKPFQMPWKDIGDLRKVTEGLWRPSKSPWKASERAGSSPEAPEALGWLHWEPLGCLQKLQKPFQMPWKDIGDLCRVVEGLWSPSKSPWKASERAGSSPEASEALGWLHWEPLGAFKSFRNPFKCLEKTLEIFAEWLKAFGALPKALERLGSSPEASETLVRTVLTQSLFWGAVKIWRPDCNSKRGKIYWFVPNKGATCVYSTLFCRTAPKPQGRWWKPVFRISRFCRQHTITGPTARS